MRRKDARKKQQSQKNMGRYQSWSPRASSNPRQQKSSIPKERSSTDQRLLLKNRRTGVHKK